mgnify:CR=1 FL=1
MLSKLRIYFGYIILLISDLILLIFIFYISVIFRISIIPYIFKNLPQFKFELNQYFWIFPIFIIVFIYEGLYSKRLSFWDEIRLLIKAIFISFVIIIFTLFITKKGVEFSRILITTYSIILAIIFPIIRLSIKRMIYSLGIMTRRVLIIGSGEKAKKIIKAIESEKNLGYVIAGIIDDKKGKLLNYKIHPPINKIERYIKASQINDVIVAKEETSTCEIEKLINYIQHKAQNTIYIPDISGIAVSGTDIRYFFQEQTIAIEIKNNLSNPVTYLTKRTIDYILAIILFILIIPLILIIGIIIKLSDKGPAIYSHKRIGKNGKEFNCYKFRTMYIDADKRLKEILEKDPLKREEWQKYWKLKDDPRVTKIGKFLRKTSLDELPQIFNVLKGEMSLVGPRPYLPREWDYIKDESPIIHALPPGITGLWQVSGRNNNDYNYRITMDAWYVKNWNLWLDIVILIKTIKAVMKREGAC